MSKSGKGTKPEPILERYGGDAVRLFGAMEASHGSDIRFSEDRLKGGSKFLNKLYNIARFISSFDRPDKVKSFHPTDAWILGELSSVKTEAMLGYDNFDPHPAARTLRNFTQEVFASHYLEMVKNRAYNTESLFSKSDQDSAIETLYICLNSILKLYAPIIPFITDYIYRKIFGKTIHLELFPDLRKFTSQKDNTRLVLEFNSALWSAKKEAGLSLRNEITSCSLPEELSEYSNDLSAMHKIGEWKDKSEESKEIELFDDMKIFINL